MPSRVRRLQLSGVTRIWVLNAAMAAAAVGIFIAYVGHLSRIPSPVELNWWELAILFFIAEVTVVNFHFRRDAHSFSLSEVPIVLGLLFASPATLLLGVAVGTGVALVFHRRQSPLKLAFNVSHLLLEAVITIVVFRLVTQGGDPFGPQGWAGVGTATLVTAALGVFFIQTAVSLSTASNQFENQRIVLLMSIFGAITNTSIGIIAASLLLHSPLATILLVIPMAVVFVGYRAYLSERQKNDSIEFLFESSRMLQRATEVEPAMLALLTHIRKMFRADLAQIILYPSPDDNRVLRTRIGPGNNTEVMQPIELSRLELELSEDASRGEGLLMIRGSRYADSLKEINGGVKDAMLASLRGESRVIGTILVADRLGDAATFDEEDLRLFSTLAGQASVSLENGQLEQSLAQLRRLEEELKYQAFHDSLTRLANRTLFAERVEHALTRRLEEGRALAVLFLDLDDFKTVNDTLGHAAGDELLQTVADRLLGCLRPQDTAARLGGDEFAVLLEDVLPPEATMVATRIGEALKQPLALQGSSGVAVHTSIGIVLGRKGQYTADEMLKAADVAMYNAKREGKGDYRVFDLQMQAVVVGRHELKADLQKALDRHEFEVHYQPVVELGSGRIAAVEALVRWRKPRRGLVYPDDFIPLAEETGAIIQLGLQVLEQACRDVLRWRSSFREHSNLGVNVNISVRQLQQPDFIDEIVRILQLTGMDPHDLVLEITESAVMDDPQTMVGRLKQLKELGLKLAIDDFGTGYSSLSWLRHFPIDILKIAKPFVDGIGEGLEDGAFADTIVRLGESLNLVTVAEGIEHPRQVEHLRRLGLGFGQGYHFGRPLSASDTEKLLTQTVRVNAATGVTPPA